MSIEGFSRLCTFATAVALAVVLLDAYVRLSNAGLSCPDWPGCYGQVTVSDPRGTRAHVDPASARGPLDVASAWREMTHRYAAGALTVLILSMAIAAWRRRNRPGQRVFLPLLALVLVAAQAALGMWSVALELEPLVVTVHLLAGLVTTALLWWLALRHGGYFTGYSRPLLAGARNTFAPRLVFGIILLCAQITLGGWVSSSHAALACPDFPLCNGELLPVLDLESALRPWRSPGIGHAGAALDTDTLVTIHFLHRLGAVVVLIYLGTLAAGLLTGVHDQRLKTAGGVLALVLLAQIALGMGIVMLDLPLVLALAHTAGAATLLLTLVTVYHVARPPRSVV